MSIIKSKYTYFCIILAFIQLLPSEILAFDTIMNHKIWTFDSLYSTNIDSNIQNIDGLYYYGSDVCINKISNPITKLFSDGKQLSTEYFINLNKSITDLQLEGIRKLAGHNYTNLSGIIGFNTYCAGTCYVIASSDTISSLIHLCTQYRGFESKWTSDEVTSTISTDYTELKLYCPSSGSFWIAVDNPSKIHAIRFKPDHNDIVPFNISKDSPDYIVKNSAGNYFVDFVHESFGQIDLTLTSEYDNDTVTIHLGECCDGAFVNRKPGGSKRYQSIILPLKKGTHTYRPSLHWPVYSSGLKAIYMPIDIGEVMPFRYCEIEGYSHTLETQNIVRSSVYCGFENDISYFHCNDETLNKIWDLCKYSVKATSFMGYYIDGDRERCPYEADALINQLSHFACDNDYSISKRTIEFLLRNPSWPSEWIMQIIMIAWNHYLFSGDDYIIKKYADLLKARTLIDFVNPDNGLVTTTSWGQDQEKLKLINREGIIQDIVDWPQESDDLFNFEFSDYNAVVNAYHYHVCKLMSYIYKAIGQYEEEFEMVRYCNNFKSIYNDTFFDKNKGLYRDGINVNNYSFHSNMFALCFDLVPNEYIEKIADFIESKGMACSVYGSQFLLEALYRIGRYNAALNLLTDIGERSWNNMLNQGSTITTEAWSNRIKPNQDWNHAWGSAPANIIQFQLLGLYPRTPGFKEFVFEPKLGSLTHVETVLPTSHGEIKAHIHKGENSYQLDINIPTALLCDVILPYCSDSFKDLIIDNKITSDYQIIDNKIHISNISGTHVIELKSDIHSHINIKPEVDNKNDNNYYYDMMGRKFLNPPQKGVYIKNREKIFIK